MRPWPFIALASLVLTALGGCTSETRVDRAAAAPSAVLTEDEFHARVPPENVRDVMKAKLMHTHAILEGITLEDYGQVERNAHELERLSDEAGWRVHTTVAYGIFSDEFGARARDLATQARTRDMGLVSDSYSSLTASCVRCHNYLRREGLYVDVPGRVSMLTESR